MRIERLRVYEANDPHIAKQAIPLTYDPLRHVQRLGIFRTQYSITSLALKCALPGTATHGSLKMHAKREAYQRHVMEIEKFLQQGKGGEGVRKVESVETCDLGFEHTTTDEVPWRLPYSYVEMLDAGLGANEEVILIGLRGRVLRHSNITWRAGFAPDLLQWEWLSEVALGVAKNHAPCEIRAENPFKLGWREA